MGMTLRSHLAQIAVKHAHDDGFAHVVVWPDNFIAQLRQLEPDHLCMFGTFPPIKVSSTSTGAATLLPILYERSGQFFIAKANPMQHEPCGFLSDA